MSVTDDGKFLKLSVVWPLELTNMNLLHKVWLERDETSSNFIARLMSFKSFLRSLRKSIQDEIRSTYTFRLPIVVKTGEFDGLLGMESEHDEDSVCHFGGAG